MHAAFADAAIAPTRVGYVNTHGTATPHGDVAEVAAVKDVFGDHAYRLVAGSTKSMTGHLLGAAGGLEFAVSVLTLVIGVIPPTINVDDPDPACDLDCAAGGAVTRAVDVALSNSFGFGGHNAVLAIREYM